MKYYKFVILTLIFTVGHCNSSVRIINLVSHTNYVVCVNFIHKWWDLQFKVDCERQMGNSHDIVSCMLC